MWTAFTGERGEVSLGDPTGFRPAQPYGVQQLLVKSEIETRGQHAVIVGRQHRRPAHAALLLQTARRQRDRHGVSLPHADMRSVTRLADILIVAIGKPEFVTGT